MNAVTKTDSSLPAHLQGGKSTSFGKVDAKDLIVPRVKLMQATSPEMQTFDGIKIGDFFHNVLEESWGQSVRIIPIMRRKEIVLWAPRGDERGILARSRDCIHWDEGFANLKFEVKLKGVKDPVTYETKGNVAESGLSEFGSAIPGDAKSRPAASETQRMLFASPDHKDAGPFLVINTRTSLARAKGLITKIEMRPVDPWGQVYVMGTSNEKGDEGDYKNYTYTADGYASEADFNWARDLYLRFKDLDFGAADEHDDASDPGAAKPKDDAATRDVSGVKTF